MLTKKEKDTVVACYIEAWVGWQTYKDPAMKLAASYRMQAAIEISKRLKIPSSMFDKARNDYVS